MQHLVMPTPIKTRLIRTRAAGPEPANTLVYLTCDAPGADSSPEPGRAIRVEIEFLTEFRIDGYHQQNHDWYVANTIVSATAMLRLLHTPTDVIFVFAVDRIEPFLALDGTLGFVCQVAGLLDDKAVFPPSLFSVFGIAVSAYVLCYEPRVETPPRGNQRGSWRLVPDRPMFTRQVPRAITANSNLSRITPIQRRPPPPQQDTD